MSHHLPIAPTGYYPTPFEELKQLTKKLGGPRIWVKRDDLTGLALGGSKTRALSMLLGQAIASGADTVVTCGPTTSNHVRLTAAAANRMGLRAVLVLRQGAAKEDVSAARQGNMLINHVLKAQIVYADVATLAELDPVMEHISAELRSEGRRPFIIPGGGYSPVGAVGYLGLIEELKRQSAEHGIKIDGLVFASGSGCIQSGLILGNAYHGTDYPVIGITINRSVAELQQRIRHDVAQAAKLVELPLAVDKQEVRVLDEFLGPSYAVPSEDGLEAIALLAELEGLLLDPCYTGKAMAGLMELAKTEFKAGQNLVFIHTGGSPGIFSYSQDLADIRTTLSTSRK